MNKLLVSGFMVLGFCFGIQCMAQTLQLDEFNIEYIEEDDIKSGELQTHTVQQGETLYSISQWYNVSVAELRDANELEDNLIKVGQSLFIPVEPEKEELTIEDTGETDVILEDVTEMVTSPLVEEKEEEKPLDKPELEEEAVVVEKEIEPIEMNEEAVKGQTIITEQDIVHIFKAGDMIDGLADVYEVSLKELKNWNGGDLVFEEGDRVIVGKKQVDINVSFSSEEMTEVVSSSIQANDSTSEVFVQYTVDVEERDKITEVIADNLGNVEPIEPIEEHKGTFSTEYIMPISDSWSNVTVETGRYLMVKDEDISYTKFYAYHRTLQRGTKVRLSIPNNAGFVEVEIVGGLENNSRYFMALSPACVEVLKSGGVFDTVSIAYETKD